MSATLTVNTTQNISIDYEVASLGDRMVAELLDLIIKVGLVFALALFIAAVDNKLPSSIEWIIYLLFLPVCFYSLLFEYFLQGQTIGKRIMQTKVARLDGEACTLGNYLLRWLFRLVDMYLFGIFVAILTIALSKRSQRVGDMVAGTTVVKMKDRTLLRDTLYTKAKENYVPVYPSATILSSSDIALIKEVVNNKHHSQNYEVLYKLCDKVTAKMQVQRTEDHLTFLQTVLKDYSQLIDE